MRVCLKLNKILNANLHLWQSTKVPQWLPCILDEVQLPNTSSRPLHGKTPANISNFIFQPQHIWLFRHKNRWFLIWSSLYIKDPCHLSLLIWLLNFTSCNKKWFKCHPLQDFSGLPTPHTMASCALFAALPLSLFDSPLLEDKETSPNTLEIFKGKGHVFPLGPP